jgi:transposase
MMPFRLKLSRPAERVLIARLEYARRKEDLKEVNRISAILSLTNGATMEEVASYLYITIGAIYKWLRQYLTNGINGIINKKSPGRPAKLNKNERKKLSKMIEDGPEHHGFESACWRTPMIQELILSKFGVFYSAHYLSQLLKNLGFSYQKAKFVAANKDEKKRAEWLKNTWPEILNEAKAKNGYILFGDEASFPQWGTLNYTWSRKGQQPIVTTSGNRRSYKVFGLIEYFTGKFFAKGHYGKLNSDAYINYLKEVLSKTRKHIFLIQDGAPYHRGAKMKKFFKDNTDRITVYRLPSYSPDFNPIEMLWKKIKQHGTHLKYFPTFESLVDKVEEMIVSFSNSAHEILSLFGLYDKLVPHTG